MRPASQDKIDAGDIILFADQFTDGWKTQTAQDNMEAIIDKANAEGVQIDAVLAENDSTALGVVAALEAKGLRHRSRSAARTATRATCRTWPRASSTWTSGRTATSLARPPVRLRWRSAPAPPWPSSTLPDGLIDPSVAPLAGLTAADFETPGGNTVKSFILQPTPITADNLNLVVDGGWIDQGRPVRAGRRPRLGACGLPVAERHCT